MTKVTSVSPKIIKLFNRLYPDFSKSESSIITDMKQFTHKQLMQYLFFITAI